MKDSALQILLNHAEQEENIRAVLLDGSRAFGKVDQFSDYDLVFVTTDNKPYLDKKILSFLRKNFGELAVMQTPDNGNPREIYTLLMQFMSGLRIDLTFQTLKSYKTRPFTSSKARLLLDKDVKFDHFPEASDCDFWLKEPTEAEFQQHCNEFWWLSPYVAKAVARGQLLQALGILNDHLRPEYCQMLAYLAGVRQNWQRVNLGKHITDIHKFLFPEDLPFYQSLLSSFVPADLGQIGEALNLLMSRYQLLEEKVAAALEFSINGDEARNTVDFIQKNFKNRGLICENY